MITVPPTAARTDWPRLVSQAVTDLQVPTTTQYIPSPQPTNPQPGLTYYDSTLSVLRTWDGTVWQDLFGGTPTPTPTPTPTLLPDVVLSQPTGVIGTPESGLITGAASGATLAIFGEPSSLVLTAPNITTYDGTGSPGVSHMTIIQTLAGASNSPHPTFIDFTTLIPLQALTFSSSVGFLGQAQDGTIGGAVSGEVLSLATGVPGLTINSAARTFHYDGSGPFSNYTAPITGTLALGSNSPLLTNIPFAIYGAALNAITLSYPFGYVGASSSGTITGITAGSTVTVSGVPAGFTYNLAANPPTYAYDGTGTAATSSIVFTETLAGASNSPNTSTVPFSVFGAASALPTPDYDQRMGSTDSQGFVAQLPFTPVGTTDKQVWINTATGTTSYNGLSPYPGFQMNGTGTYFQVGATGPGTANTAYGPRADTVTGLNSLAYSYAAPGIANQIFFAEGQTFPLVGAVQWAYLGSRANTPFALQSYDPSDPLNLAKHGRAGTSGRGARPIWTLGTGGTWPTTTRGDANDYGGWAFRGIEFRDTRAGPNVMQFLYCMNNMLFENNYFNNLGMALNNSLSQLTPAATYAPYWPSQNSIIRFCGISGGEDGIFSDGTLLTIEDCIWYHNGWSLSINDRNDTSYGDLTRNQALYIDSNGSDTLTFTAKRNVVIDPAAAAFSMRGQHLLHHNVMIDAPLPEIKGGGSASDAASPDGDIQKSYCQFVMGGADINSANPRMQGFGAHNGKPAPNSYMYNSLYVNCPGIGQVNNNWITLNSTGIAAQPTYMDCMHNRAFGFVPDGVSYKRFQAVAGTGALTYNDVDNVTTAASPMSNAQIYAAMGYSGKTAMVADMLADPTKGWAYQLLAIASSGFGFDFNYTYS